MTAHRIVGTRRRASRPGRPSAVVVECSCGKTASGRSGVDAALSAYSKHVKRAT